MKKKNPRNLRHSLPFGDLRIARSDWQIRSHFAGFGNPAKPNRLLPCHHADFPVSCTI